MAKRRKRSTRKKKDSPFWQWILVAVAAFGLYQGLDYLLASKSPRKSPAPSAEKKKIPPPKVAKPASPVPKAEEIDGPVSKWTFEAAKPFLPDDVVEDNYRSIPTGKKYGAVLAYSKKIPGKTPGPQGLTNTSPGIRLLQWNGKKYLSQDLSFEDLGPSLGKVRPKKFMGPPQVDANPVKDGKTEIFSAKIFLDEDEREVQAFLAVKDDSGGWAPLHHASGKKMPAAFVTGTTQNTTRKVKQRKHGGKHYLIIENGTLDELKTYKGYQWNLQAYFWDGKSFVYDREYSKELTKAKKSSQN